MRQSINSPVEKIPGKNRIDFSYKPVHRFVRQRHRETSTPRSIVSDWHSHGRKSAKCRGKGSTWHSFHANLRRSCPFVKERMLRSHGYVCHQSPPVQLGHKGKGIHEECFEHIPRHCSLRVIVANCLCGRCGRGFCHRGHRMATDLLKWPCSWKPEKLMDNVLERVFISFPDNRI